MQREHDLIKSKQSIVLTIYPWLVEKGKEVKYSNFRIPLAEKRIIAQLRLSNKINNRILLKNSKLKVSTMEFCKYCTDLDSNFHRLLYCKRYSSERSLVLPDLNAQTVTLSVYLNNINKKEITKLNTSLEIIMLK